MIEQPARRPAGLWAVKREAGTGGGWRVKEEIGLADAAQKVVFGRSVGSRRGFAVKEEEEVGERYPATEAEWYASASSSGGGSAAATEWRPDPCSWVRVKREQEVAEEPAGSEAGDWSGLQECKAEPVEMPRPEDAEARCVAAARLGEALVQAGRQAASLGQHTAAETKYREGLQYLLDVTPAEPDLVEIVGPPELDGLGQRVNGYMTELQIVQEHVRFGSSTPCRPEDWKTSATASSGSLAAYRDGYGYHGGSRPPCLAGPSGPPWRSPPTPMDQQLLGRRPYERPLKPAYWIKGVPTLATLPPELQTSSAQDTASSSAIGGSGWHGPCSGGIKEEPRDEGVSKERIGACISGSDSADVELGVRVGECEALMREAAHLDDAGTECPPTTEAEALRQRAVDLFIGVVLGLGRESPAEDVARLKVNYCLAGAVLLRGHLDSLGLSVQRQPDGRLRLGSDGIDGAVDGAAAAGEYYFDPHRQSRPSQRAGPPPPAPPPAPPPPTSVLAESSGVAFASRHSGVYFGPRLVPQPALCVANPAHAPSAPSRSAPAFANPYASTPASTPLGQLLRGMEAPRRDRSRSPRQPERWGMR